MRELFDQLLKEGESPVHQLVTERRQESVDLEFKQKADASNGEPNRIDRKNLAEILSAFSNSAGGLVVWGIVARENADKIDCAIDLKPISQIDRFKSDIIRCVSQALMPRHDGIIVEMISCSNPPGSGYLIILVERSERRPHRAELGVAKYFKRSSDSSIVMEHYDIEDSFKRLVVPWLELRWEIRHTGAATIGSDVKFYTPHIDIFLRNPSPVTVRFPFLILRELGGINPEAVGSFSGFVHRSYGGEHHFCRWRYLVIHPELSLHVTQLSTPQIEARRGADGQFRVQWDRVHSVRAGYQCGCYNSRHTVGQLLVAPEELLRNAPGSLAS